ncbi:MAG: SRPBCC family protein [Parvularculaceae bacterium]|nr:SRPBCC family protein [Parvularculaceae bacterium]
MSNSIAATASIVVNASQDKTRAAALALDPVSIVRARGLIPGVKSISGHTGAWSAEGQTRKLSLSDGATAEEMLVALTPNGYRYRIANFTGPFRLLVREAKAQFEVTPRAEGSLLTWSYAFTAKGGLAAAILSFLVDSQWNAFMDAALERLKTEIERP